MMAWASIVAPSAKRTVRADPLTSMRHDFPGRYDFCSELGRLPAGPIGQLCARDTVGKAEIVLDP